MYTNIDFGQFVDRFRDTGREEDFSYYAKKALFDHYEQSEEETGAKIELDIIAICCDWGEYSIEDIIKEYLCTLEELRDNTVVLDVPEENTYLVLAY